MMFSLNYLFNIINNVKGFLIINIINYTVLEDSRLMVMVIYTIIVMLKTENERIKICMRNKLNGFIHEKCAGLNFLLLLFRFA
jgi:hypothetical protein